MIDVGSKYLFLFMTARQVHPYHLVDVSPWPFLMSVGIFSFAMTLVSWLTHYPVHTAYTIFPGMLLIAFLWWRDVVREAKGGFHTATVQKGIMIGFLLFLLSEIMLFVSFIWAYLHSSLAPTVELGSQWPPVGIESLNPWSLPLVGTTLLLASGLTITLSHHAMIKGDKATTLLNLLFTIVLGGGFIFLQYTEYMYCSYQIADSVFGTVFYLLTGLHGLHVIAGVSFLVVCFVRLSMDQLTSEHHLGYLFAIWYWPSLNALIGCEIC
uniref:Cytochrome c oxidase subunit 3 n=1 Tax=Chytriomyces confervae TaxID=246404 RepID=A0A4P8NP51_9FUNG|nr:cytochrome c oxidase subunit 3 [Chytriomyces confervae]QCQ69069.1 cytochrome c oxidase subunit 3 [Chytriomyces confervae]